MTRTEFPMSIFAEATSLVFLPEIVGLLLSCLVIVYICQRLSLVPIVGFLLTGVLVGPNALGLVRDVKLVDTLAEVGVMLLLFTIGMELSLDEVARLTRVILVGGGLQTGLTLIVTMLLLLPFGVDWRAGLFTGFLLALSSDVLTLKILSDRGETRTPAGHATLGILVFQDLAAVVMILALPFLAGRGGSAVDIVVALVKAVGTIAAVLIFAGRLIPKVLEMVARTCLPELFLLTVTAICFGTAYLTNLAGLDLSLGAFLAGLVISGSRLKDMAFGEVLPLRTMFSAAFFVSLGMLLDPRFVLHHPGLLLAGLALVVVLRLLATAAGLAALGMPPRVMLVTGLLLAQVGEFGFVLQRAGGQMGLNAGGLGETGAQAFIATSVVLMVLTPGFAQLASWLDAWLRRRSRTEVAPPVEEPIVPLERHVIIAGYGAAARPLARMLRAAQVPFGILTLSPDGAEEAEREGMMVRLGDSTRGHGLHLLAIEKAKMLVCADDDPITARRVAAVARTLNPTLTIIILTKAHASVEDLTEAGADHVIAEEREGIVQLFVRVLDGFLVPRDEVARHVEVVRGEGYAALQPGAPVPALTCSGLDGACLDTRRIVIRPESRLVGQTLAAAGLKNHGLEIIAVQRRDEVLPDPPDDWRFQAGDRLVARASTAQFMASADLFRRPESSTPVSHSTRERIRTHTIDPPAGRCAHSDQAHAVTPRSTGCETCLLEGKRWVHLRVCMSCGHVGCCDSSPSRHATAHYKQTGHAIVRSLEAGESWGWCYVDEKML
jgi:monovalent cation:H+ antiporter-2, CPA2 family